MKIQYILFILLIIFLEIESETNNNLNSSKNFSNKASYNLSEEEMDKILFCSMIWLGKIEDDYASIEELKKELNITKPEIVNIKIGVDIVKSCLEKVKIEEARKYFYNLTMLKEVEPDNIYFENTKIDFDGYRKNPNFILTNNEETFSHKIKKTLDLFQKNREEIYNQNANKTNITEEQGKVKIGEFDINNIPKTFNIILFLVVFGLLFGGTLFFIKNMNKKKEIKKKKKYK